MPRCLTEISSSTHRIGSKYSSFNNSMGSFAARNKRKAKFWWISAKEKSRSDRLLSLTAAHWRTQSRCVWHVLVVSYGLNPNMAGGSYSQLVWSRAVSITWRSRRKCRVDRLHVRWVHSVEVCRLNATVCTHTHTHTYIYIYIRLVVNCWCSDHVPVRASFAVKVPLDHFPASAKWHRFTIKITELSYNITWVL